MLMFLNGLLSDYFAKRTEQLVAPLVVVVLLDYKCCLPL